MEVKTVLKSWGLFGEEDPLNRWVKICPLARKTRTAGSTGGYFRYYRPCKLQKNTDMKTSITWVSELRFRCSWARWNHHNEHDKMMQENIIVQQGSIKPNVERWNLSIEDEPGETPKPKTQQVFHTKSVFGELELVMKVTTSSKPPHRENPNKNQERWWRQVCKGLSSLQLIR